MARPRKVHQGDNVLIEIVVRVPNFPNEALTMEVSNIKGRILARNRNPTMFLTEIEKSITSVFGLKNVAVIEQAAKANNLTRTAGLDSDVS